MHPAIIWRLSPVEHADLWGRQAGASRQQTNTARHNALDGMKRRLRLIGLRLWNTF